MGESRPEGGIELGMGSHPVWLAIKAMSQDHPWKRIWCDGRPKTWPTGAPVLKDWMENSEPSEKPRRVWLERWRTAVHSRLLADGARYDLGMGDKAG